MSNMSLLVGLLDLFQKFAVVGGGQKYKKGCSTVGMLPEGNRQEHSWQKDFGQLL